MKLSIIIPAFNEEATIEKIVEKVKSQEVLGLEKEIIVIDDGSSDSTLTLLKNLKGIILLNHPKNLGKGAAIRTGLSRASGEFVLIQDADLELNPKDYPKLLRPLVEFGAEVVYGSRILNGKNSKHGVLFYIGGRGVTFIANLLYGTNITDEPIGYKVFKRDLLKSLNLKCIGFEFCPEVTAKIAKRKIPITEVAVSYNPRTKKEGKKLRFQDGILAVWTLIKYKFVD